MTSNQADFPLPLQLAAASAPDGREGWLARLPNVVAELARRWSLLLGPPFQPGGATAWVAPARDDAGADLVLKVGWRHVEAENEADALRLWAGRAAVRLHAAAKLDDTIALLLERCVPGTALTERAGPEQDAAIASLLRRLWLAPSPGHPFRSLAEMCGQWAEEFEAKLAGRPVPLDMGLVREGVALFRALPTTAGREVVLCTDLHAGNVLAAEREPWLVIDPKPHVGDPTYDALQHMLNSPRLPTGAPAMIDRMAHLLDLDGERLRRWLFARCVLESLDSPDLAAVALAIAPR